ACGAWHGRLYFANRDTGKAATGHGSPLPHMVHGGPGRAGSGEEMGGIRGVMHYMQRTAIQASPDLPAGITKTWVPGARAVAKEQLHHPMRCGELAMGRSLQTAARDVTVAATVHYDDSSGDTRYPRMDEDVGKANPCCPGLAAHGYRVRWFPAGLFVDPPP